ncbi:hypothetical protein [Fluoribacter gormanii]|uniref:hypothetical protein n=1 Tax=Fluoribacter gormanii TaxID=464 RepID=UPI00104100FF|nr:hypothetical protein [Fluoribacter gormanii]
MTIINFELNPNKIKSRLYFSDDDLMENNDIVSDLSTLRNISGEAAVDITGTYQYMSLTLLRENQKVKTPEIATFTISPDNIQKPKGTIYYLKEQRCGELGDSDEQFFMDIKIPLNLYKDLVNSINSPKSSFSLISGLYVPNLCGLSLENNFTSDVTWDLDVNDSQNINLIYFNIEYTN